MRSSFALLILLHAATAFAQKEPTVGDYLGELERLGLIDRNTGSRDALTKELDLAEERLAAGDATGAAMRLYAIVESPRFLDFSDSPEYQNAEYDLAVALALSGAYEQSLTYVTRTLERGPGALYFAAAHRRAVDIALETRDPAGVLARLQAVKLSEPLPVEASGERAYLAARVAYDKGDFTAAEGELTRLSRKSRLYTAALYLRGVIQARQGGFDAASEAFCEIVDTPDDDRYTFYVDDRYFTIKDLARLGLGRIAHEEERYEDAWYHYFQIPDDSDKLAEALFEAGWSMYQKRELGTARDLVAEFLKTFPDSPLALEALLLAGYIELADCKFTEAEKRFMDVVAELQPVFDVADRIRKSKAARRAFMQRAIARTIEDRRLVADGGRPRRATSAEDKVLSYLQLDPRFSRLHDAAVGLRREAGRAEQAATWWRVLASRVAKVDVKAVAPEDDEARAASELARDIEHLRQEIQRLRQGTDDKERLVELEQAERDLVALGASVTQVSVAADELLAARADPRLGSFLKGDLERAAQLASRARELADQTDAEMVRLSDEALDRLHGDLRRVLDKAKLGKIDSVIGQKRKLELEVEDLAQGRYPPELYDKLFEMGLIGDDEEYWPPENELWTDEYEGWR